MRHQWYAAVKNRNTGSPEGSKFLSLGLYLNTALFVIRATQVHSALSFQDDDVLSVSDSGIRRQINFLLHYNDFIS